MTQALLGIVLAVATTTPAPAPPVYRCARAPEAVTIDGKIDEAEWSAAAWTEDFASLRGRDAPAPMLRTRAKIMWDDDYVYLAAEMSDPDVRAAMRERDASLY